MILEKIGKVILKVGALTFVLIGGILTVIVIMTIVPILEHIFKLF